MSLNSTRSTTRWIVLCLLAVGMAGLLLPRADAHAQSAPGFDSLQISLWPEYDKPSMLVIYRANLPPYTQFPASVSLPIPTGVQPNAVAQGDAAGNLVDVDYSLEPQADRTMVNLQVSSQLVWLEFYQDLQRNGSDRSFTFQWPGGLAIASLSAEVQNPPGITGLTIQPSATDEVVGQYGLTYRRVDLGPVGPSDQPTLRLSYSKDGDALTADSLQQTPQPSPTQSALGSTPDPGRVVTGVVAGLVIILAAAIGVLYFRFWRESPKDRPSRSRHRSRSRSSETSPSRARLESQDDRSIFCHNCGTRAGPEDRFCRSCGSRLRR